MQDPEKEDLSLTKEEEEIDKEIEEEMNEAEVSPVQEHSEKSIENVMELAKIPVLPPPDPKMTVHEWLYNMKWKSNPFTFNIAPNLFVGYKFQIDRVLMSIEENHKIVLILGPTGSGKTTFLKWLSGRLKNYDILYIGKPPQRPEEFVSIFSSKYRNPWYAFWRKNIKSIYEVPDFLSSHLRRKRLVVMLDEAHEANTEILEWLRVLNDQVENMSVVISGLPNFENQLRSNLETFTKRITTKTELLSLTKEETEEMIRKRIQSVGGTGNEFSHLINHIYDYTGGFPREIIRICDMLVNNAILGGRMRVEFDIHEQREVREEPVQASTSILSRMTPMQKEILEMLSTNALTPGQIANLLDLEKYKSRQHAVRSVNNIVKKLQEDGFLERKRSDKAFIYSLSPKISTLFVKR